MKFLPLFMLCAFSPTAFASYENSCELVVKLLEDTSTRTIYINRDGKGEIEETKPPVIHGIVKKAKVSGRADSGCKHYIGQTIQKALTEDYDQISLKKGQKIRINILIADYKGIPSSESVSYLREHK